MIHDMYEVFGPKFFDNYKDTPYKKFVAQLILDEPTKNVRGMTKERIEKPLTTLYLNYAKVRLWIDENMPLCLDEEKLAVLKETSKAAGAKRIEGWAAVAERKFLRLETRLCSNINKKQLVRTTRDDNPYYDNPTCDNSLFREKQREKMNEEKKREREEARRQKAAEKQAKAEKKRNRENKRKNKNKNKN